MVNDCAHVGETLVKYFPADVEAVHLKRSRGFWDKTFGIAWRILRANADLYHVHYLLQDCYLALKFGKHPIVGHAHGSDLRSSLKHRVWGRIVRHNLKHCDKVLVSTPDILDTAREYRGDAEYLPNPVDTSIFYPKPTKRQKEKLRVLIATYCDWKVKGTNIAIRALSELKENVEVSIIHYGKDFNATIALAESLGLHLDALPKISHQNIREYYWNTDVVVDQFRGGVFGMVALEAIACGRPVIIYVSSRYKEYNGFPLKDIDDARKIVDVINQPLRKLWRKQFLYFRNNHDPKLITKRFMKIYEEMLRR